MTVERAHPSSRAIWDRDLRFSMYSCVKNALSVNQLNEENGSVTAILGWGLYMSVLLFE